MMIILDAKTELEAHNLVVYPDKMGGLWIAAGVRDVGNGIKLGEAVSILVPMPEGWMASFPTGGQRTYDVFDSLPALVSLIANIYRSYRESGGELQDAFKRTIPNADTFLSKPRLLTA